MRARRFGPAFALAAIVALGACSAQAGSTGIALDRTQADPLNREYDEQLDRLLTDMIASAEIGPDGELLFTAALGDRRFLKPDSGRYWQISGSGQADIASRSLWERRLQLRGREARAEPLHYDSDQFPGEPLRVAERTVRLPGSNVEWRFVAARARGEIAEGG